jgi:hypothetical protein
MTVVQQQAGACFHRGENLLVRQLDPRGITRGLVAIEHEHRIGFEHDAACWVARNGSTS